MELVECGRTPRKYVFDVTSLGQRKYVFGVTSIRQRKYVFDATSVRQRLLLWPRKVSER